MKTRLEVKNIKGIETDQLRLKREWRLRAPPLSLFPGPHGYCGHPRKPERSKKPNVA